ncbi:hypothetical protein HRbin23_00040 [bacterium HR23]|nr:hypothetical protein HRbin23_00040 [bacterium HR23]
MGVLYIAGTSPHCGKTALVAGLALALHRHGKAPIALKPVASAEDADNAFFRHLVADPPALDGLPTPLPADGVLPARATEALRALAQGSRPLLLEGLDSVLLGSQGQASTALVEATSARVVLVVPYRPDLRAEDLESARSHFGQRLLGVLVNWVWRYHGHRAHAQIAPALERAGLRVLGLVPEDRVLSAPTVAEVARCVEGEIRLYPEKGDALVEAIMVGGWALDEGQYVFSRHARKAVVVRADRPDLHLAALATSTTCLVLTGGVEPVQYTVYEAEQTGTPLVWTRLSTLAALQRLEGVAGLATARVPEKARRFADLLAQHADLPALQSALLD